MQASGLPAEVLCFPVALDAGKARMVGVAGAGAVLRQGRQEERGQATPSAGFVGFASALLVGVVTVTVRQSH